MSNFMVVVRPSHTTQEDKSARKLLQQEVQEGNLKYQQLEGRIAELGHKNAQHHGNVHVDGDDLELGTH